MTKLTSTALAAEMIGQPLRSVSALVFDVSNDNGPAIHVAICLHFDSPMITISALTDTSELCVDTKRLEIPVGSDSAGYYTIEDISDHPSFKPLIGLSIRNWWSLTNDAGYNDGLMIAFTPSCAVCFIAMNNTLSILQVSGEQCS